MSDANDDATTPPRVLLFFDYACPFCYVDWFRFDRLRRENPVELVLVPFELRPDMPSEGISASEYGLAHSPNVEEHLIRLAGKAGVRMMLPDLIPHTHRAMVMGEVARDEGDETHRRVHLGIFDAYYGRGLDIGSEEVLLALAEDLGLDATRVADAWLRDLYEERMSAFEHIAAHLGVTATPAALVCDELVIGSRPYRALEEALRGCSASAEPARPDRRTGRSSSRVEPDGR